MAKSVANWQQMSFGKALSEPARRGLEKNGAGMNGPNLSPNGAASQIVVFRATPGIFSLPRSREAVSEATRFFN